MNIYRSAYITKTDLNHQEPFTKLAEFTRKVTMQSPNTSFIIAGTLSCIASFLHLAVIVGGPEWYRTLGAGEAMVSMAEQGSWYPVLVTLGIASVLFVWGLYAFSAAGLIFRLPMLKPALMAISAVYLLRGLAGLVVAFTPNLQDAGLGPGGNTTAFWLITSAICLVYAAFYVIGLLQMLRCGRRIAARGV